MGQRGVQTRRKADRGKGVALLPLASGRHQQQLKELLDNSRCTGL